LKKDKQNKVHRGELLKKVVSESDLSVGEIVSRMNYASRNTFYSHLKKADLSLGLLKRYGRVLKYDFSEDIDEIDGLKLEEEVPSYLRAPLNLEDATSQRDFYHRLYMELLEQVRRLEAENALLRKDGSNKVVVKKK
jgi:hypothetical protein